MNREDPGVLGKGQKEKHAPDIPPEITGRAFVQCLPVQLGLMNFPPDVQKTFYSMARLTLSVYLLSGFAARSKCANLFRNAAPLCQCWFLTGDEK
ncbi:MAG: hypothetical protein V4733_10120 [Verrucomicrobiota bacterium]